MAVGLGLGTLAPALGRARRRRLFGGLALGLAPYLVHLAAAGIGPAWRGMVIDPVFNLRDGRRLPLPPSAVDLDGFLQKIAELDALDWPAPLNTPQQLRAWFFVLLATIVVLLVAGVWAVVHSPGTTSRALLALALFSAGLLPQALQRPDSTHLAWVSAVPLGLLPVALCSLWGHPPRGRALRGLVAGGLVIAVVLTAFPFFTARRYVDYSLQSFGHSRSAHEIANGDRVFYYGRKDVARDLNQLVVDVDALTEEGDRLFVGTRDLRYTPYVDSFLYFLLPRLDPATYYIEMDPGVANAPGSRLAADLASADVVVLGSVWDGWVEPNRSTEPGSDEPNQVLARDFCLEHDYGDGLYRVYVRCP